MSTKKKMLQAAAGNAGGEALNVEDVFSTYLYEGNGSTQTITNGIDLDGEGGLVWIKGRPTSLTGPVLTDTVRGATKQLQTHTTSAEETVANGLTSFLSDGFSIGSDANYSRNGDSFASWTFRKAPKFFDVVTYTGDGTNDRDIAHSLGCPAGFVLTKRTDGTSDWIAYPVKSTSIGTYYYMKLNSTAAEAGQTGGYSSSTFRVNNVHGNNTSGQTYVAYLFAHNDGDGEFGPDGDADIIKCGSFTPPSSGEQKVSLGFEPQFIITFNTGGGDNWRVYDTMRGWDVTNRQLLNPNQSAAESSLSNTGGYEIKPTATGFIHEGHTASSPHIYIAIRRGTKVPESGTEVFAPAVQGVSPQDPTMNSGFVTDFAFHRQLFTSDWRVSSRLTGTNYLEFNSTGSQGTDSTLEYDFMDGYYTENNQTDKYAWMFRRAPNFFDVVAYTGDGVDNRDINHNLGVIPEFVIVKNRNTATSWVTTTQSLGSGRLILNDPWAFESGTGRLYPASFTETTFRVGFDADVNNSGDEHIAYLFASLDGVSKVGSYTGNGTSQTIDCGFTSGARFVLIKRTDSISDWALFDSARGIVSGNDPLLRLNETLAEVTDEDIVDPISSGFIVNSVSDRINVSGASYIFYAIA